MRLFKTILEQKSLRRTEVIEQIFDGKDFYAELRLRKLKRFGYLNSVRLWFREPESYLLGEAGELRRGEDHESRADDDQHRVAEQRDQPPDHAASQAESPLRAQPPESGLQF